MAIKTQSIICRRMTALDRNLFSHQDLKYKFAGWATSRSRANSGIVDYTDLQLLSVVNDAPDMELYAVWKPRDTVITYADLKITSSNVTYDKTTAPVFYTVTEIKTYEGLATPYAKTVIANDVAVASNPFGMNGDPNSDNATLPRTLTISYTHPQSGLVATVNITQGGYTPIYKLYIKPTSFGTVQCYSGTLPLTYSIASNGLILYSSTNKNFTLKATPKILTDIEWISKPGCAYYKRDYATRLKHAAPYPNSNSCGSWKTITTKLYDFLSWSGGNINGITSDLAVAQGSVSNPPTIAANFVKAPLLKNTVIGTWNATWQIAHTTYQTYTDYKTSTSWVPTCNTGLKYFRKYGITTMHEGVVGHGYYKVTKTPYTARKANTTYTTHKNLFYGASSVDAPYVLYVPADGLLRIKGKFGTAVFGKAETVQTGGFAIKKYSFTQNVYDDYLTFYGKADATNNYVIDIDKTIPVKKGDKLLFTKIASKMAIWIDTIELSETA